MDVSLFESGLASLTFTQVKFLLFWRKLWLQLLQSCNLWKINNLHASFEDSQDNFNHLLEALAKEAVRGSIQTMKNIIDRDIAQAKMAQLKKVWKITKEEWTIMCSRCMHVFTMTKTYGGWVKIVAVIKKFNRGEQIHDNICKVWVRASRKPLAF